MTFVRSRVSLAAASVAGLSGVLALGTVMWPAAAQVSGQGGAGETMQLPTLQVQGESGERALGPVDGYVATRSATGTKTDTPLIEVPQSISVVTRDQMVTQDAQTVGQALRYTVGVEAESRANLAGGAEIYFGRGFVLDRYLNGLQLQGSAGFITPAFDPFLLERVEVLRGPASVLYGASTPGGLVNMVSKLPTTTPLYDVMFQGGTFNSFQGAFDIGGPIPGSDSLFYRLTGIGKTADNQVQFNQMQRLAIAPSATWKIDGQTDITFYSGYQYDPHVGLYNFVPAAGSVRGNINGTISTSFFAGDPDFNTYNRRQFWVGYLAEHRFDETWTVRQNLRYLRATGQLAQVLPFELTPDEATLLRNAADDHETTGTISLDNQAQAKFSTGLLKHTLLFGVDYQHTNFDQRIDVGFNVPPLDIFAPLYNQPIGALDPFQNTNQKLDQVGVYTQDQIKLGPVVLTLGGRQDWASNSTRDNLLQTTTSQNDSKFSWRAGAVYLSDFGVAPYFSYSTSFQPTAGVDINGSPFKPTTARQYEGGLKLQPQGWKSFGMLSLYQINQQNALTVDPLNPIFFTQTGEIRSRGVEVSATLNPLPGLNLIGAFSYNDPVVTRSNGPDLGKMPVFVPNTLASGWVDYTFQSGELQGVQFGAGVRYVGRTFGNDINTLRVPPYTLLDLMASYNLVHLNPVMQGWRAAVNVSNLTDEKYVSSCSGEVNCVYGLRRTVLVSLRKSF